MWTLVSGERGQCSLDIRNTDYFMMIHVIIIELKTPMWHLDVIAKEKKSLAFEIRQNASAVNCLQEKLFPRIISIGQKFFEFIFKNTPFGCDIIE